MKKFLLIFIAQFLLWSCARVGTPAGGAKDTIPPRFLGANIDSPRVNVSTQLKTLRLDFDEYVNLKNIQKQLVISPPIKNIKKIIPSNLANRYILIEWGDTLQANTTYNFNFGTAITDYNEGNVLPYFNFAFSTGAKLDSLYISGTAQLALPQASTTSGKDTNIVLGLYQAQDSLNYRQKPYYLTKADQDGYFELDYLAHGRYKLIAFNDENGNSVYDEGKEAVGFLKDDIDLQQRISGLDLSLYPARPQLAYKELKPATGGLLMLFEGQPKEVKVAEVSSQLKSYQVTHQPYSDSVRIWLDPQQEQLSDKGTLLKWSYDIGTKQDTVQIFYKPNEQENALALQNDGGAVLAPEQPLRITANAYLNALKTENWQLKADSTQVLAFDAQISEKNPYQIEVKAPYEVDKKYRLLIPKTTVSSFYITNEKAYAFDFEIGKPQNYGSFMVRLSALPPASFWIQLLDQQNKVAASQKTHQQEIKFSSLKPGTYRLQILVDNNENGIWDTANLYTNTLAEGYYLFPKKIEVRPMWDLVEDWNITMASEALENTEPSTPKTLETAP
ncbi:Ig-like domain-containing protein [Riemerella columbina]|uniref:Ig-like domain-containing protein n=1 Tax=Riemerella columbina TaxID=103810 RepID=UPI00266FD63B|nr:Ig-like domain-containing protein [Riemerella columbina]WKS95027.1 Ig-like domain-containing protein [Riemerella columbina]